MFLTWLLVFIALESRCTIRVSPLCCQIESVLSLNEGNEVVFDYLHRHSWSIGSGSSDEVNMSIVSIDMYCIACYCFVGLGLKGAFRGYHSNLLGCGWKTD